MAITLLVDPFGSAAQTSPVTTNTENSVSRKRTRRVSEACCDMSPPDKKQRTVKKSVRFNSIVHFAVVECVDPVDAPKVWYSKEEFRLAKRRDQQLVREELNAAFGEALVDVLEATTSSSSDSHSSVGLKPQSRHAIAHSPFRGLERELLPCFRQRKRQVMANILKSQATLKAWKELHPEKPADHTAMILAGHCRKLARASQRFARLLAQADAMAAL